MRPMRGCIGDLGIESLIFTDVSMLELTLERLADHLTYTNPFDDNRVTQTDSLSGDVTQIHEREYQDLIGHAQKTCGSNHGRGVVVTGSAGSGKSHLLARFAQWTRSEKNPFVYLLNLQAGPDDLLRTILRTTISILTKDFKKVPKETRLYRLVVSALKESVGTPDRSANPSAVVDIPLKMAAAQARYEAKFEDSDRKGSVYHVLWQFFEEVYNTKTATDRAGFARRWLSGDALDFEEAKTLQIPTTAATEDGCALSVEQLKEVLKVLCQFASFRRRAFILCFDQVDTLNEEQVSAWSATTHALLDLCPNLLVVTSGVDLTFRHWTSQNLVSKATWDDRIRQFTINLLGITPEAAEQMIRNRLQESLAAFVNSPKVAAKIAADRFFPLGTDWWQKTLSGLQNASEGNLRPRDVIRIAGSAWDAEARRAAECGIENWLRDWPYLSTGAIVPPQPVNLIEKIDKKVQDKLAEHLESRKLRPEELPVDAGNVVGLLKAMLNACQKSPEPYRTTHYATLGNFALSPQKGKAKLPFQLTVDQRTNGRVEKVGVRIADAFSGAPATTMLKQLVQQLNGLHAPARVLLVVDSREPLSLAKMGQEYKNQLLALGDRFTIKMLSFAEYATLDALAAVVGLAQSGDLEVALADGSVQRITEAEVLDSHHRNERYLRSPVICDLIGNCQEGPTTGPTDCSGLSTQEFLEATHARLALETGLTTVELTNWYMKNRGAHLSEKCRAKVHDLFKSVVLKLHEEEKVQVTPVNDYYMVLPKKKLLDGADS